MLRADSVRKNLIAGRPMSIGVIARILGVTLRTLRFYEQRGLISPTRVGSGRLYSANDLTRMRQILKAKTLGFSLHEIRVLLDREPEAGSPDIVGQLATDAIDDRLAQLQERLRGIEQAIIALREQRRSILSGRLIDACSATEPRLTSTFVQEGPLRSSV